MKGIREMQGVSTPLLGSSSYYRNGNKANTIE